MITMTSCRFALPAVLALMLPSCVSYYNLPKGYTGPTATIRNSGSAQDAFKATVFEVAKIDGKLSNSSAMQTPRGGGPVVQMGESQVKVAAGQPLQVELSGHDQFAADGAALMYSFGGNVAKPAKATVNFTPKANATYVVKGQLAKQGSAVWLEDAASGKRVP
ncbi:hypothetical protein [Luteolibacter soli]|uniref:Lipoprotein n=1 Tax=Luteolibacter soli TaxID=3135280 RepID=A0ABU9AW46_9BACT